MTVLRLTWSARAIALTECPQTRSFIIRRRTRNRQRFALCRFALGCAGAVIVAFSAVKGSWPLFGWTTFTRTGTLVLNETQNDLDMTIIEIRAFRNAWQVYESVGVQPVFLNQEDAISYAEGRACFRCGEIRIVDPGGAVKRIIPFNEADRRL
jgi:hypothetical protein